MTVKIVVVVLVINVIVIIIMTVKVAVIALLIAITNVIILIVSIDKTSYEQAARLERDGQAARWIVSERIAGAGGGWERRGDGEGSRRKVKKNARIFVKRNWRSVGMPSKHGAHSFMQLDACA